MGHEPEVSLDSMVDVSVGQGIEEFIPVLVGMVVSVGDVLLLLPPPGVVMLLLSQVELPTPVSTHMNVPPTGSLKPVLIVNSEILKFVEEEDASDSAVTTSNESVCTQRKNAILCLAVSITSREPIA